MKTFDEIYEALQSADNNELNNLWKEAKKEKDKAKNISYRICLTIDIGAIILLVGTVASLKSMFSIIPILQGLMTILIINLFVILIANAIFSKKTNNYNKQFKQIVINRLMNNFYDNLEYFPDKEMPEYIYDKLDYEYYNRYHSEDYLEAQINGKYSIQMAEILTQKEETYRDSDGKTHTRTITKFHGLFAKIEMDKSINSELQIMQNGSFALSKKLKMDSSEFEKYFDIKASNQIIGMQLLTADVMEELVDFENKTKMKFDIFIKGNELYLRFHSGEMFEAGDLKKGPIDKDAIQEYFYMLNLTYNLSNKIIKLVNETEI